MKSSATSAVLALTAVTVLAGPVPRDWRLEATAWPDQVMESVLPLRLENNREDAAAPEEQLPFDRLIEGALGFGLSEIARAVESATLDHATTCIAASGWDVGPRTLERYQIDYLYLDRTFLFEYLDAIDVQTGDAYVDTIWQDPAFGETVSGCMEEARAVVGDPAADLATRMADAYEEVSNRAMASAEYQTGVAERDECLGSLGLSVDAIVEIDNETIVSAEGVLDQFENGLMSADEARTQLTGVEEAREERLLEVEPCTDVMSDHEFQAVANAQEDYLAAHPGFVEGVIVEYQAAVDQLRDYLSGIDEEQQ